MFNRYKELISRLIVILGLTYLIAIPLGFIKEEKRFKTIDLGIIAILLLANSDIIERLKNLKINKDTVDFEFDELRVEVNNLKSNLDQLRLQDEADIQALRYVDLQLSETIPLKQVSPKAIKEQILKSSPFALELIYHKAKEVRHCAWKFQKKGLIERTIPIFQALTESDYGKERHRFHAQLGYALKDQEKHDWKKALFHLEKAIELWQADNPDDRISPYYCFNWVYCAVELENLGNHHRKSNQEIKNKIIEKIKAVADCKNLTEALNSSEAIDCWLQHNQLDKSAIFQSTNSNGICPKEQYLESNSHSGTNTQEERLARMR